MFDSSKEFLDECGEAHALVIGLGRGFKEAKMWKLTDALKKDVRQNRHYFIFGYITGNVLKIVLIACFGKIASNIIL